MSASRWLLATLDGFAVEGGYDQPFAPRTCFAVASALGMCSTPGDAARLWDEYELVLDLVPGLGIDGVRLNVEWARIEPRPGEYDTSAIERYRAVLTYVRSLGLRSVIVAIDAAWPAWLGPEAWLLPWVEPVALGHIEWLASTFGDLTDGLVSFARPESLINAGYFEASAPPFRRRASADARDARRQIAAIMSGAAASSVAGPMLVTSFREIPAVADARVLAALLSDGSAVDQIHLRSLVRGSGPTAAAVGLLVRDEDRWRVGVGDDVLAVLA